LRRVYLYLNWRLMQSNLKKEPTGIEEAIEKLTVLRDAWATMLGGQSTVAPMAAPRFEAEPALA
jgi:flagellin-specific chaperone FliS